MTGWDSVTAPSGSWVTLTSNASAPFNSTRDFWQPSYVSRPNRVFPQSANTRIGSDVNDLSVTYRIQTEFPVFTVRTGCNVYIRSGITEPL